jgi:hypothetical protein
MRMRSEGDKPITMPAITPPSNAPFSTTWSSECAGDGDGDGEGDGEGEGVGVGVGVGEGHSMVQFVVSLGECTS